MSVLQALEIEKLKPTPDGVYVCVDEKKKVFEIIPLEKVNICINGKKQPLGELLFSLIDSNMNMSREIEEIKTNHNKLVKGYKKQIAALKVQIAALKVQIAGGKE